MTRGERKKKKRILLVEDDPSVLKMTKYRLEHEGYEVVSACDGEEAIRQAESALPIHLALLDVKLPKRSGYEVCQALKQCPKTSVIPIIVFTGSITELGTVSGRIQEVGASDWIRKPFQSKELMAKIRRALGEEREDR